MELAHERETSFLFLSTKKCVFCEEVCFLNSCIAVSLALRVKERIPLKGLIG